jgi:hypothetical protein
MMSGALQLGAGLHEVMERLERAGQRPLSEFYFRGGSAVLQ